MKACIVLQNHYGKVGHAMAKYLKNHHGVDEFCAYVFSQGAKDYIDAQKEIKYDPILVDHVLHDNFKNEKGDPEFLKKFEETYCPPYPWQHLYCDRKLMMSIGPKEETTTDIDPLYDHDSIIKIFQARARSIEEMLKSSKPDFIVFFAIGALAHIILYVIARKLGIKIIALEYTRIGDLVTPTSDYNTLSCIDRAFNEFKSSNSETKYHEEGRKVIENFAATKTLNLQGDAVSIEDLPGNLSKSLPKRVWGTLVYLRTLTKNYLRNRHRFVYGKTDQNPLLFIWHKLKQRYRLWRGCKDLYDKIDLENDNFIFFPLHYEPELATLLLSPFYFNQIELIGYIARSLPLDYKLYVKEHPAMYSKRARSYYKKLKNIPNVVLVDTHTKSFDIIKKSKLITTITGSAGWEAILLGKPVITFGNVFYNSLSFVTRISNIETLPQLIRVRLKNFSFDKKELDHYMAACLKESLEFDFIGLWFEEDDQKIYENKGLRLYADKLIEEVRTKPLTSDV
jgi:hypothetical protein